MNELYYPYHSGIWQIKTYRHVLANERTKQLSVLNVSIRTTNGVERQHCLLKKHYLKEMGFGGTLTSLVTILVTKFFPDMKNRLVSPNNILFISPHNEYVEYK